MNDNQSNSYLDLAQRFIREFWLIPILPVGVAMAVDLQHHGGTGVGKSFFTVTAQVIPVLLLALVVELRVVDRFLGSIHDDGTPASEVEREAKQDSARAAAEVVAASTKREVDDELAPMTRAWGTMRFHMVGAFFLAAALGEAASLYAIGAQPNILVLTLVIGEIAILGLLLAGLCLLSFRPE